MSASLAIVYPSQGQSYYAKDNYYTKEGSIEHSEWFGKAAAELGLQGPIDPQEFQNLLDARLPDGQERLPGYQYKEFKDGRKHQAGIDITYAPPKSVSFQGLALGDQRVVDAFHAAVNRDLERLERQMSFTRIQHEGKRELVLTGKLVVGKFHHDTNRLNEPLLHTHCVVIGATPCADGRWRALQANPVWATSRERNRDFMRDLERELNARGVQTVKSENGFFEIKGYSREQIESLSTMASRVQTLHVFEPPTSLKIRVDAEDDRKARAGHFAAVKAAINEITERGLFKNPAACQEIYLKHLREELEKRHFELVNFPGGRFELAGYTQKELAQYAQNRPSGSSIEVQNKMQERVQKMEIRPAKGEPLDRRLLREQWLEKGHAQGVVIPLDLVRQARLESLNTANVSGVQSKEDKKESIQALVLSYAEAVRARALELVEAPKRPSQESPFPEVKASLSRLAKRALEITPGLQRGFENLRDIFEREAQILKVLSQESREPGLKHTFERQLVDAQIDRLAQSITLSSQSYAGRELELLRRNEPSLSAEIKETSHMKLNLYETLSGFYKEADLDARKERESSQTLSQEDSPRALELAELAKQRSEEAWHGFSFVTEKDLQAESAAAQQKPEVIKASEQKVEENRAQALAEMAKEKSEESLLGVAYVSEKDLDKNLQERLYSADERLSALRFENYEPLEKGGYLNAEERAHIEAWDKEMERLQKEFEGQDLSKLDPERVKELETRVAELEKNYQGASKEESQEKGAQESPRNQAKEQDREQGDDD